MVNQQVGQHRNRRVLIAEKLRLALDGDDKLAEFSGKINQFSYCFTIRMFDDDCNCTAGSLFELKICSRLPTFECCFSQKSEFCFHYKGFQTFRTGLELSHWRVRDRICYQLCRNSSDSCSRLGAAVKPLLDGMRVRCLSPELKRRNLRSTGATLYPSQTEATNYPAA
jgi:hypothetical protein